MKGILLAGGNGTRLYPATRIVNKHLLPVSDRPILFYSLTTLMLTGIREVMIITRQQDLEPMTRLLDDGSRLGMNIKYAVQEKPRGIAEALLIGRNFITERVCLALGDNIFLGEEWATTLRQAGALESPAVVLACRTNTPQRFGVLELAENGKLLSIEEKPVYPRSKLAIPGVYFYGQQAVAAAESLQPSARGELEISDVNRYFLSRGQLSAYLLDEASVQWFDTGTASSYREACEAVYSLEAKGIRPGCPEEIALSMGYIGMQQFETIIAQMPVCDYRSYLVSVAEGTRDD